MHVLEKKKLIIRKTWYSICKKNIFAQIVFLLRLLNAWVFSLLFYIRIKMEVEVEKDVALKLTLTLLDGAYFIEILNLQC